MPYKFGGESKRKKEIMVLLLLLSCVSRVRLCATPQTTTHQAPLSLGFSRQKLWSGLPLPSQERDHTRDQIIKLQDTAEKKKKAKLSQNAIAAVMNGIKKFLSAKCFIMRKQQIRNIIILYLSSYSNLRRNYKMNSNKNIITTL